MSGISFFENNLGFIIGKVHRHLRKEWQSKLTQLGVTTAQSSILSLVNETPNISQRDASRALEIDVMAVRRVLQDLVDQQLIQVEINPNDIRKFSYAVTPKGKSLAAEITKLSKAQNQHLEELLGQIAVRQLGICLTKILEEKPAADQKL